MSNEQQILPNLFHPHHLNPRQHRLPESTTLKNDKGQLNQLVVCRRCGKCSFQMFIVAIEWGRKPSGATWQRLTADGGTRLTLQLEQSFWQHGDGEGNRRWLGAACALDRITFSVCLWFLTVSDSRKTQTVASPWCFPCPLFNNKDQSRCGDPRTHW